MTDSAYKDKNILTSVNHTLKVLDLLSVRTGLGVSEISRLTGYDKASVYKMLYTLTHRGYVIKDHNARYRVSEKIATSASASERQNVSEVASSSMKRLRDLTGETILLGVLNTNGKVVILSKEDGSLPDATHTRVAYELDAYSNAMGKVLLAHLAEPFRKALMEVIELYPLTPYTVTDSELFQQQLKDIAHREYVEQYDENYPGHADISAPIFDDGGRVIAALSVFGPSIRIKEKKDIYARHLSDSAAAISFLMGYRG